MQRLIDANEIKKREKDVVLANGAKHRCFDTTMLFEIPTVDAEPVKYGHWCFEEFPDGYYHWECSECKKWFKEDSMLLAEEWKYCPNCGAKMNDVEEE